MANQERYKELISKKNEIESTIQELTNLLESQKGVGMTENLIDKEGYPRADIDVYSCRHARHEISCLQNDHKVLMDDIEQVLIAIHAEARQAKEAAKARGEEEMDAAVVDAATKDNQELKPFAVVDRVDQGSPANKGGIEVDDLLVQFGSITLDNFSLPQVAAVLKHSIDKSLNVTLLRRDKKVKLTLTPTRWSGPGFLGCNINPLANKGS